MLKLKKTSVKLPSVGFSKIGVLGVYFLVFIFTNSCGFHLAKKKSWTTQAESLRLEKIENASKRFGVDFEIRETLELRIFKHSYLQGSGKNKLKISLNFIQKILLKA